MPVFCTFIHKIARLDLQIKQFVNVDWFVTNTLTIVSTYYHIPAGYSKKNYLRE